MLKACPPLGVCFLADARLRAAMLVTARNPFSGNALYTRNAARLCFADHERGMLRTGMLAGWVAVSADPTACDPGELRTARVLATAVDGAIVHAA